MPINYCSACAVLVLNVPEYDHHVHNVCKYMHSRHYEVQTNLLLRMVPMHVHEHVFIE